MKITLNNQEVELTEEQVEYVIEEHKKEAEKPKRFRAVIGDEYWFINSLGRILSETENGSPIHDWRYKTRNYFQTEEEAQHELDRQNAVAELRDLIEELNESWKVGWDSVSQAKYYIAFDHAGSRFFTEKLYMLQYTDNWKYLEKGEYLPIILERLGEEKIKLALGIEE